MNTSDMSELLYGSSFKLRNGNGLNIDIHPKDVKISKNTYELIQEYCPACGEPEINYFISHAEECPFHGDEIGPEDGNY